MTWLWCTCRVSAAFPFCPNTAYGYYEMHDSYGRPIKIIPHSDGTLWLKVDQEATYVFELDPFVPNRYRLAKHYGNPLQPPTTVQYDEQTGRLLTVTSADGKVFTFTYDTAGHITAITDPF